MIALDNHEQAWGDGVVAFAVPASIEPSGLNKAPRVAVRPLGKLNERSRDRFNSSRLSIQPEDRRRRFVRNRIAAPRVRADDCTRPTVGSWTAGLIRAPVD